MPTVTLEQVESKDLTPREMEVVGSEAGRLLRFKGAILARAEVNQNHDEITDANITELATTLPLMALDLEHQPQDVVGFFTDARNENSALSTDGIIFADRFPEVAQDVVEGRGKLSIEANSEQAECSVCGGIFARDEQYCDHLRHRLRGTAVRRHRNMTAAGGGVVRRPAGSNTHFDHNRIQFMASLIEPGHATSANFASPEAQVSEVQKTNAERAMTRLTASFQQSLLPFTPQLNIYRPVLSPLLYTGPDPAWVDEIADRVMQKMTAQIEATAQNLAKITVQAPPAAPETDTETTQAIKEIVAEKLGKAYRVQGPHSGEEAREPGNDETGVAASASSPASVGLVGFAWGTPAPSTKPLKAAW